MPLMRAQDRGRGRTERASEEVGVERSRVVAEQLGRAQLKHERQLRSVVDVGQLERRVRRACENT